MQISRKSLAYGTGELASGPLIVHPDNPRYFCNAQGRAVYLTGSHTWASIQERRLGNTPPFDYAAFLEWLVAHRHNCTRLWAWEHGSWMQFTDQPVSYVPNRYRRTGPGLALDGLPRYDLTQFDASYFARLRERVAFAGRRGIYVMVMLFQGFSIEQKLKAELDPSVGDPWRGHPFHRNNNINGIDGDPDDSGRGRAVHTLRLPRITALQEQFVERVVRLLNDQDHIIWEISNESPGASTAWQYHVLNLIRNLERLLPKQHPLAMTYQWDAVDPGTNATLFASQAEAISPNPVGGYQRDPPANDGRKVILNDTDHLWGIGGTAEWVWKSFLRGLNPIFMDPYFDIRSGGADAAQWEPLRRAMGQTLAYAQRLDLAQMAPADHLLSVGCCLAQPGQAYLLYLGEDEREVELDLSDVQGKMAVEWLDPEADALFDAWDVTGGDKVTLAKPGSAYRVALISRAKD